MKLVLVNTPLKEAKLLKRLDEYAEGDVGFDTEIVGPALRNRKKDFTNISHSALLGLSVAFEDEQCFYLPVRHRGNNCSYLTLHRTWTHLQRLAAEGRVWAHNAKFDHQVAIREGYPLDGLLDSLLLAWLTTGKNTGIGLKVLAREVLDRLSPEYDPTMGTKTGAEVLEYACHDALNTLQLGAHFSKQLDAEGLKWFREQECTFAHGLAEMKLAGIGLDRKRLAEVRDAAQAKSDALMVRWTELAPDISPTSSKQLQVLFTEGQWYSQSRTKTGLHSTSAQVIQWQVDHDAPGKELAQLRLDLQEVKKIIGTYTDGNIEEALQWADKKIHPDLFQVSDPEQGGQGGTVTGRLSSSNPNIQNQPAHGEWAQAVKECYIPDPGYEFTSADYSQIETRYFADYVGGGLLDIFQTERDPYVEVGSSLGLDRKGGKVVVLGFLLYGGGPKKMSLLLKVDETEGAKAIAALNRRYPRIEEWRKHVIAVASKRGPIPWVKTRAGRIRYVPELNPEQYVKSLELAEVFKLKRDFASAYGMKQNMSHKELFRCIKGRGKRLCVNYLVQGGSRDVLLVGMNEYRAEAARHPGFSLVTTVHDEVLTQHPLGLGEQGRQVLKHCLEGAGPKLGLKVPLLAKPITGPNWFEVKD